MNKTELRKIFLEKRRSLTSEERNEQSREIAARFFHFFDLRAVKFLHCFLPIEKFAEVDTRLILERIWQDFPRITTLVPRVDFQTREIENLKYTAETDLIQNNWAIHEPSLAHNETIESGKIDLVLIPLVCFDARGYRVGYGKGFYDKFLSRCHADVLKIGLSFFPPVAEVSDVREFDEKLDFCVTPAETFDFKKPGN